MLGPMQAGRLLSVAAVWTAALVTTGCASDSYTVGPESAPGPAARAVLSAASAVAPSYRVSAIPFMPEPPPGASATSANCGDDCVVYGVPLGFSFEFYGHTFTTVEIGSNGFVGFGGSKVRNGCCEGAMLPTSLNTAATPKGFLAGTAGNTNLIALAWTDWNPQAGGTILYETRGVAPHRRFIVQYTDIPELVMSPAGGMLTGQLVLAEGSNDITMSIMHVWTRGTHRFYDQKPWQRHRVTQGIQNEDGTQAAFVPGRVQTTLALDNDAIRFSPGPAPIENGCLPGLTAWWRGQGDARDVVGAHDGVLHGNATFSAALVGDGFSFDGSDGTNMTVADAPDLNPTASLTVMAWVKLAGFDGTHRDLVAKDGEQYERQYFLTASDMDHFRAHITTNAGGLHYMDGATPVLPGRWYHVAMTYDGSALRLFVDGQLDASIPVTGVVTPTSQPLRFGGGAPYGFPAYYAQALVDEVALFSRALDAGEIAAIAGAGAAGMCPGVIP